MAEDIKLLRERQQIEKEIAALRQKGKNLTDEELAIFSKLEARKKSLLKAESLALKEQQKNQSQAYSLQSKLSSLQDEIGQRVKRNGRFVFELAHGFRIAQSNMAPMIGQGVNLKNSLGDVGNLMDTLGTSIQKSSAYLEGTDDNINKVLQSLEEAEQQRQIDINVDKSQLEELQKNAEGYFTAKSGIDYKVDPAVIKYAKDRLKEIEMSNQAGDKFIKIQDRMKEATDRMGSSMGDVAGLQSNSLGLAKEMAMNYDKVGTAGFSSSVDKAEELAEQTKRQAKLVRKEVLPDMKKKIKFMEKEMSVLPAESKEREILAAAMAKLKADTKDLVESSEEAVATAERNVAQADQMRIANKAVAQGAELILGPFQKLNSLLESAPGGKYFAALFDTEGKMKAFTDTVQKNLLGAVTPDQAYFDETANRFRDLSSGEFLAADDEKILTITKKVQRDEDGKIVKDEDGVVQFEKDDSGKEIVDTSRQLANIMQGAKAQVTGFMNAMPQVVTSLKLAAKAAFGFAKAILMNPIGAMVAIVALLGVGLFKAFSYAEGMRKEFGTTREDAFELQRAVDTTAMNFKMMGVSAEDVKTLAQGIADNMGGVRNVTQENLNQMANLVGTFGMSAEKLAPTITAMKAIGAGSNEAAAAQLEQIGNMAQLEGVAPAKVFEDMTADMETFSKFGKEGGANLAKAAITARKLGINMEAIASSSDALLDFESSIQDQMEAQMLTGRMINTDKARELALAGDLDGQAREIAKQVGSQAEFDKMNVVQRQAMAKAFGLSVADLASMVANQEELNSLTDSERAQREASQKRSEKVNEGMKSMGAELGALFNSAMEPLKQLMIALGPTLGVLLKAVGVLLKLAFAPLKPIFAILNFAIIKPIGFVVGLIGSLVDGMFAVQDGVKGVAGFVGGGLVSAFGAIKPILGFIAGMIGTVIMAPINLVLKMVNFIKQNFMTIAKVVGALLFPQIAMVVGLVKLIMSNFDSIKNTVLAIGGFIVRLLVSPFVNLFNMIKMIGTALFDFFMSPIRMVKDAIMGILPNWALSLLGFGDEGGEASVNPESSMNGAPKSSEISGTRTATSYTVQRGQVTDFSSVTTRLDKLNNTSRENVDASKQGANQTRRLNSSIATG